MAISVSTVGVAGARRSVHGGSAACRPRGVGSARRVSAGVVRGSVSGQLAMRGVRGGLKRESLVLPGVSAEVRSQGCMPVPESLASLEVFVGAGIGTSSGDGLTSGPRLAPKDRQLAGSAVAGSGARVLPKSSRAARLARTQFANGSGDARSVASTSIAASSMRRWIVLAVLVVAALLLLVPSRSSEANGVSVETEATSVLTVQQGDSLWSIAARVMPEDDTRQAVAELRRANNLTSTDLVVGQRLVVPRD